MFTSRSPVVSPVRFKLDLIMGVFGVYSDEELSTQNILFCVR